MKVLCLSSRGTLSGGLAGLAHERLRAKSNLDYAFEQVLADDDEESLL